jgi:type I restriction enzyme S subunit
MSQTDRRFGSLLTAEERRQQFTELGWWVSIPLTAVPAHWLYRSEQRLDGSYYAQEVGAALRIVKDSGFEVKPLIEVVSEIFILGRFRRVYATDKKAGWPYLSASEALEFRPISDRWLAKNHAPKQAHRHFVKGGWILVSSSGTVGRTILATQRLEKYFLTHDLLRIVPEQSPSAGYLYAFLSTWIGQVLMTKDQYGSAIKHLEPHHLASVLVPLLPDQEQQAVHTDIIRVYNLRDQANKLLDEADELLHTELGLPRFDENLVPYLSPPPRSPTHRPEIPHPHAFTVKALELDDRLDGAYHVPLARTAVKLLYQGKYQPVRLGELVDNIHLPPRFKRIYVREGYGVPFLRPSHLP